MNYFLTMISNKIIEKEFLMELVYLWVEGYKNIREQGFNFTPNFECEFFPIYENGKLSEKSELNITPKENHLKDFFGENINITAIVGGNGSGKSSIIENLLSQFFEHIIVYITEDEFHIISSKDFNCTIAYSKEVRLDKNYIVYLNSDILKSANIIDYRSYINSSTYGLNLYVVDCVEDSNFNILNLNKFQQNIYKKIFKVFKEKINLKFNFIPTQIIISFKEEIIKELSEEKREFCKKLKDNHKNLGSIKGNGYEIKDFITNYFDNNQDLFFELLKDEAIGIMLYDKLDRNIFHLSNGERKQFIDMILIYEKLKEKNTNCLIFLDEPDLGIHPNWQKGYIKELTSRFTDFGKKLHFIITSHSPFILSDLPKENIIFLEKGKQVYPFDDGKQTFGANIHTLLSHGFFMKDGLMGEFAKDKIDIAIKYLNQTKLSDDEISYCENIISIIGEPIIKRELQRMLKNKMELSNKTEIDTIKDEIKLLTERLEKLEPKDEK